VSLDVEQMRTSGNIPAWNIDPVGPLPIGARCVLGQRRRMPPPDHGWMTSWWYRCPDGRADSTSEPCTCSSTNGLLHLLDT
jgi:hypothetical protein